MAMSAATCSRSGQMIPTWCKRAPAGNGGSSSAKKSTSLLVDEVDHFPDGAEASNLQAGELDAKRRFDVDHQPDVPQRVPVGDVLCRRRALDHELAVVENIAEYGLQLADGIAHLGGARGLSERSGSRLHLQ